MRVAVVGAGITGLATAYELVRAGHEVRCFEAGSPMAARSVGDTRIFRLAHTDPSLVSLAAEARAGWDAWSAAAGQPLVGREGTVVSGDVAARASAMAAAGAPHAVVDERPSLPAPGAVGPFLVDPSGGVIRARAAGEFLRAGVPVVASRVLAVAPDGLVTAASGEERFDAVVLAAGAGTAALAAGCGIDVPAEQAHHARFTFPLRDPAAAPPAWIDRSGGWRAGFTSYGHLVRPGFWAIGGHPPDLDESWATGREAVTAASRKAVLGYVTEHVTDLRPEVVETVYCTFPPGLGDGVHTASAGRVSAVWGDNLFKFAPVIGRMVAAATISGTDRG